MFRAKSCSSSPVRANRISVPSVGMWCASAEPLLIMTQYQEQMAAVFLIFPAAHAAGSDEWIPIMAAILKEMNIVMKGWDMGNPGQTNREI